MNGNKSRVLLKPRIHGTTHLNLKNITHENEYIIKVKI